MKYLPLIAFLLFLGAGCPQQQAEKEKTVAPSREEQSVVEDALAPDDGLDEALQELDIVDTDATSGWGSY